MRITLATFLLARRERARGGSLSPDFLVRQDKKLERIALRFPSEISHLAVDSPDSVKGSLLSQVEVEITKEGEIRRFLEDLEGDVARRVETISRIISDAMKHSPGEVRNVVDLLGSWMANGDIVRFVGAGRASLAGSLPANRLAHGGAAVWILGDRSPLPNSRLGGGIVAVSASGETEAVLDILKLAREVNRERSVAGLDQIRIIGVANAAAKPFRELCTPGCFIGIRPKLIPGDLTLRALGDIEEYAMSELLDALVVAAGFEIGVDFRSGHEDLVGGLTGPWHQHDASD